MKVIRPRAGALVASCGLLASTFGLTVITVSPAATQALSVASAGAASSGPAPDATVIEAGSLHALVVTAGDRP
jgi:hypothetical protein